MKEILACLFFLFIYVSSYSQIWGDSTVLDKDIFYTVEEHPKFKNGVKGYYTFIANNLKINTAPKISLMQNVVNIRIVIRDDGKVVYGEVLEGVDQLTNKQVLKLLGKMPPWIPAKQNNKKVSCFITLPILLL